MGVLQVGILGCDAQRQWRQERSRDRARRNPPRQRIWELDVVPANAGTHNHHCLLEQKPLATVPKKRGRGVWVPAFAGTTCGGALVLNELLRIQLSKQMA